MKFLQVFVDLIGQGCQLWMRTCVVPEFHVQPKQPLWPTLILGMQRPGHRSRKTSQLHTLFALANLEIANNRSRGTTSCHRHQDG